MSRGTEILNPTPEQTKAIAEALGYEAVALEGGFGVNIYYQAEGEKGYNHIFSLTKRAIVLEMQWCLEKKGWGFYYIGEMFVADGIPLDDGRTFDIRDEDPTQRTIKAMVKQVGSSDNE